MDPLSWGWILFLRNRIPAILNWFGYVRAEQKNQRDIQITINREIGGKLGSFNVRLNDLLISPAGIVKMLDGLKAAPSQDRAKLWRLIKSRADDTHTRLENLYGALETLNAIAFFAKSPNLVNDIGRVIEAKMHGLYLTLSSLPVEEVPGEQVIETLIAQASDLQPMNTRVEAVQNKIGNYIEENEVYIRTLLKAEEKKTNSKIRLVEEQAPKPVSQGRPSPVSAKGKPKVRPKQVKGKASRG